MYVIMRRLQYLIAVLFLAASCGGVDPELMKEPNFQSGYDDGCRTASSRGSGSGNPKYRNDNLFRNDKAYEAGWRNGYSSCGQSTNPFGPDF
jgi:hypothetical protein